MIILIDNLFSRYYNLSTVFVYCRFKQILELILFLLTKQTFKRKNHLNLAYLTRYMVLPFYLQKGKFYDKRL